MPDSSNRLSVVLPGMPRLSPVQTEGCIISSKWKVRRQAAEIRYKATRHNNGAHAAGLADPLAFLSLSERSQGLPKTFGLFCDYNAVFPCPFCHIKSFIGPAE